MHRLLAPVRSFFEREQDRSPVRGFSIVLLAALVPVLGNAVISATIPAREQPTLAFSSSGTIVEASAVSVYWAVVILAAALAIWIGGAAIAYVVTDRVGGTGGFWRFATLSGWAWLPVLVTSLLWAAALVGSVAVTAPPETAAGACEYCARLTDGPAVSVASVAVVVGWVAGMFLWIPAIEVGRDVTGRVAAVTAAVPVAMLLVLWAAGVLHF